MSTATVTQSKPSIDQLARQFYAEAHGDEAKATQRLQAKIMHDPELTLAAVQERARFAINFQVSANRDGRVRAAMSRPANPDRGIADGGLSLRLMRDGIKFGLMGSPLHGSHKALAESVAEDIQAAYDNCRSRRFGYEIEERYYGRVLVVARKSPKTPIKDLLTEEDLVNFRTRAEKEAEAAR